MFEVSAYINMYATFSAHAWGGYGYFITFSDDYSRFRYMHGKSDALDTFIEFKARSDNLLGIHIKSLWLNQDDMSNKFDSFCCSMGLFCKLCTLGSLLQNGEVERKYQILMEIVRSWIGFSSFPKFFWGYVL